MAEAAAKKPASERKLWQVRLSACDHAVALAAKERAGFKHEAPFLRALLLGDGNAGAERAGLEIGQLGLAAGDLQAQIAEADFSDPASRRALMDAADAFAELCRAMQVALLAGAERA